MPTVITSTRTLPVPALDVFHTLADVGSLAAWNPAIDAIKSDDVLAKAGKTYRTRVRGLAPATIFFRQVGSGTISYEMRALAATEIGTWTWVEHAIGSTRVTHTFRQRGVLTYLLAPTFRLVPELRLQRLEYEVIGRIRRRQS